MPNMPTVTIGGVTVSRFIVGGNPFSGNSHQPGTLSREMRDYFTVDRIKSIFRECEAEGVNTFLGRGDNHISRLLVEYWNEGGQIQFIAQTCPERASLIDNIDRIAGIGTQMCYLHGGQADGLVKAGDLTPLREAIEFGKGRGMVMGIAGHRPETHIAAVEADLGADFHCCSFYNLAERQEEYLAEDRDRMVATIKDIPVPVIGYKILAAGRNEPEEAFRYAFEHLRDTDPICVGVYPEHRPDEIRMDAELARRYGTPGVTDGQAGSG